jgi:hypothetical protein
MDAPPIIYAKISTAEFVEADPETGAITGADILVLTGVGLGKRLGIGENDASQQAVGGEPEPVLRLQV